MQMGGILSFFAAQVLRHCSFSKQAVCTPAGNPLPHVVHQVVQQHELGSGRLVLIGDIHGCLDELHKLLNKIDYKHNHDNLVLVGDLVNKGPKSLKVVSTVRSWCRQGKVWLVRGNHDESALAARRKVVQAVQQGTTAEIKPTYEWVKNMPPQDEEFMTQLPFSLFIQGYDILVVHAGLVPGVALRDQDLRNLTHMRDVVQTSDGSWVGLEKPQEGSQAWAQAWPGQFYGAQWSAVHTTCGMCVNVSQPVSYKAGLGRHPTGYDGPHHVFFGHDAKRRLQKPAYATGLDTGCVYGGQLTACVLPALSHVQHIRQPKAEESVAVRSIQDDGVSDSLLVYSAVGWRAGLVSVAAHQVYEQPKQKSAQAGGSPPQRFGL